MRNRYILVVDAVAVLLCVAAAFVLRLDWQAPLAKDHPFAEAVRFSLVAAPLLKIPVFYFFGLYARYWRFVALNDLLVVVTAVSASSVLFGAATLVAVATGAVPVYPRSVPAIDWLLTLLAVAGVRVAVRVLGEARAAAHESRGHPVHRKRVLVVGAGQAGTLVVREMQRNPRLGLAPVGFLDDDPAKLGKSMQGTRVIAPLDQLEEVVVSRRVDEVVVAIPKAPGAILRAVAERARHAGVPAKVVPGVFELLEGGVSVSRLRDVDITDLLRRRPIDAAPDTAAYLHDQHVLVTGAGGSIGSELCRQIAKAGARSLVLVGHGENSIFDIAEHVRQAFPAVEVSPVIADIRHRSSLDRVFATYRPSVVFHAAAHKHVPLMEAHPSEAVTNNVLGTATLVECAIEHGVERFVLISTDKAVEPSSVMGATKRLAEMIVRDAAVRSGRRFLAVRFGNVLGSRGSVVPFFRRQIARGGPLTVTHPEMTRYFMTIPEAVYLVLKAGGLAHGSELFVLNMGQPVKITDLATDLIRLSGYEPQEIEVIYTGLRPGEKLAEELWEPNSRVEPVGEGDVFRVQEPDPPITGAALHDVVGQLAAAAQRNDVVGVCELLMAALPSFAPAFAGLPDQGSWRDRVEAQRAAASERASVDRSGADQAGAGLARERGRRAP